MDHGIKTSWLPFMMSKQSWLPFMTPWRQKTLNSMVRDDHGWGAMEEGPCMGDRGWFLCVGFRVLVPVGSGVLVPVCWFPCVGSRVLVSVCWFPCLGSSALVPVHWFPCAGFRVLVPVCWFPCVGSGVLVPLYWFGSRARSAKPSNQQHTHTHTHTT